jgi:hypothetical protein
MSERLSGYEFKIPFFDLLGWCLLREVAVHGACNLMMAKEVILNTKDDNLKLDLLEIVNRFTVTKKNNNVK